MPEDKKDSALDEFMAGLGGTNPNPFESADPFAPKAQEKTEDVIGEKAEDEKPLPFHKDPKVLRFIEKEVEKRAPKVQPMQAQAPTGDDELGDILTEIIGNDTPEKVAATKKFRKALEGLEEKGAQRAIEQLRQNSEAELAEERKAQDELDEAFEDVEETYNVDLSSNTAQARKTRAEFVEYIRKIAPKNADGEVASFPDISAAFEGFQEIQKRVPVAPNRAKELAARSMAKSSDATVAPKQTGKSWRDIDKLFSNLSS